MPLACAVKEHPQRIPFNAISEDRKMTMFNLLMDDYVGHMRVAMEQELAKNALRMSQLAAVIK